MKGVFEMARPQPRVFNQDELKKFKEQSDAQTSKTRNPLTTDENKYPMFDIPVNGKKVVYVPNFTDTSVDPDTGEEFTHVRWDRGAYHNIRHRGSYARYRCTAGIEGIEGFDGSCPFCDTSAENWDLYNLEYADACKVAGQDPDTDEGKEAMKDKRKELLGNMAVGGKMMYVTFPLVEIECKDGTTNPELDENGNFKGRLVWYTIAEDTYNQKWGNVFKVYQEGKQHPAGRWLVLDYTYDAKNGKPTKMQSAGKLQVIVLPIKQEADDTQLEQIKKAEEMFDDMAKDWTPALAQTVIYNNQVYDVPSLTPIANEVMESTRSKLQVYEARSMSGTVGISMNSEGNSPESLAASFGGVPEGAGAGVGVDE